MTTVNRFFSNLPMAMSALKTIAIENKCTTYLYEIFYGSNQTPEYSVRFANEIQDPQSIHVIEIFTPKNQSEDVN